MALESFDLGAGGDVPEANGLVVGSRDKETGVGREGNIGDALLVALKFMERSKRRSRRIGGGKGIGPEGFVSGGGSEKAAVGREFDG